MATDTRDQKIQQLKDELLVLASMVDQMVRQAVEALINRNLEDSQHILDYDHQVNEKHLKIERQCLDLISKDPPILAADLRLVASLLEVNTEIERIGDSGKNIAQISIGINFDPLLADITQLSYITEIIMELYFKAIGAFVASDKVTGMEITKKYLEIRQKLENININHLDSIAKNPDKIQNSTKYLWVLQNLKIITEHIVNICKRISYLETGKLTTLKSDQGKVMINQ